MALMYWIQALIFIQIPVYTQSKDLTLEPGHLKPFGEGRPSQPVEELIGAPNPTHFFENFVKPLKPLKMVGAAKQSQAFSKWSDDYFLSLDEPPGHTVSVETVKKERRDQNVEDMSFKDFVRIYNSTDHYMVNAVPKFISHDMMVPCPLQCKQLIDNNFVDNVMWFSSGGTKSVVHTDAVDNMNCLLRGNKSLVMVDPALYRDNVDMDHPEGSYSSVDVDKVDYSKYPGLAEVEFYHVHLTPGDCLYIPYKWIHQVRSFGSNLAVNIWWKHYLSEEINFSDCNVDCNPKLTLKDAYFTGFSMAEFVDPEEIRDHLHSMISPSHQLDFARFIQILTGLLVQRVEKLRGPLHSEIQRAFTLCDVDKDGVISLQDVKDSLPTDLQEVGKSLNTVEDILDEIFGQEEEEEEEEGENSSEDENDPEGHDEL